MKRSLLLILSMLVIGGFLCYGFDVQAHETYLIIDPKITPDTIVTDTIYFKKEPFRGNSFLTQEEILNPSATIPPAPPRIPGIDLTTQIKP